MLPLARANLNDCAGYRGVNMQALFHLPGLFQLVDLMLRYIQQLQTVPRAFDQLLSAATYFFAGAFLKCR